MTRTPDLLNHAIAALLLAVGLFGCDDGGSGGSDTSGTDTHSAASSGADTPADVNATDSGTAAIVVTLDGVETTFEQGTSLVNNFAGVPGQGVYTSFSGRFGGASGRESIIITFRGDATGSFVCGTDNHTRLQYADSDFQSYDTKPSGSCAIIVTEFGGPGAMIRGTFQGSAPGLNNTVEFTDGRFAIIHPGP